MTFGPTGSAAGGDGVRDQGGFDYQILTIPLTQGLKTKDDVRAMAAPGLSICSDARFDELGGIQTRYPFQAWSAAIFGGGTLSNVRRLAVNGSELLVFTDTGLYSWNAQLSQWVLRGTHLAAAVEEVPRFVTTGDQVIGDRAELNGTIVYTWTESINTAQALLFAAAIDKMGAVIAVAQLPVGSANSSVIALSTRILLFNGTGTGNLVVRAIDPASPAAGFASAGVNIAVGTDAGAYDVVRIDGTDQCIGAYQRTTPTSYTIFTVTAGLSVATSTKARTADGPLAVAVTPDGAKAQIVRGNGSNIQGDLITISGLVDVFTAQSLYAPFPSITPVNQIAAAFSATLSGGNYTCSVWWSFQESNGVGTIGGVGFNTVTTANVVGTSKTFIQAMGVASRAFQYNGAVYVWLVWAKDSGTVVAGTPNGIRGAVQNTYFLYRADGFLVAQAAEDIAGGYSAINGRLPGITAAGATFSWAGSWRRTIQLGNQKVGNATRSPRDIAVTFDDSRARRTSRLGQTLYISGGMLLQYDGINLVEVGTLVFPWAIAAQDSGIAGNLGPGVHSWKGSVRWQSATGESERSTTATGVQLTVAAGHLVFITSTMLFVTRKQGAAPVPTVEFWRTTLNAPTSAPFYLITSNDPTQLLPANNPFLPNNPQLASGSFVFNDNYSDATLAAQEANPENAGGLEHLAPPPAQIVIATDTRLFLAGVAGDDDAVRYSREREEGEIASFHDSLRIPIPPLGGAITALAVLNETLVVFRQTAIYALPGNGFDNGGGGQNYGPANLLASDVGALSHETVALIPQGLIFKSRKGWFFLSRDWVPHYIGADVAKFDAETVLSVEAVESNHQIRCITSGHILVWDYLTQEWSSWSISDAIDGVIYNGQYLYLSSGSNTVLGELSSFPPGTVAYGLDVETGWIKPAEQQGAARVDEILILGEYRGPCLVRIRTAFDYQYDGAGNPVYTDETFWTPSPAVIGSALQVRRGVSRGKCESLKIRITASSLAKDGSPPSTEAIKLTGLALKVRLRQRGHTRLPAAQKV
jgi:hypothetical protein